LEVAVADTPEVVETSVVSGPVGLLVVGGAVVVVCTWPLEPTLVLMPAELVTSSPPHAGVIQVAATNTPNRAKAS